MDTLVKLLPSLEVLFPTDVSIQQLGLPLLHHPEEFIFVKHEAVFDLVSIFIMGVENELELFTSLQLGDCFFPFTVLLL